MTQRTWKLREAKDWLVSHCFGERQRSADTPTIRITLNHPPSDERPPDLLIWEAFQLLEDEGILAGHPVSFDNTGSVPVMINGVALTPQAIEMLENAEEIQAGKGPAKKPIGFDA